MMFFPHLNQQWFSVFCLEKNQVEKYHLLELYRACREYVITSKPEKLCTAALNRYFYAAEFYCFDLKNNSQIVSRTAFKVAQAQTISEIREIIKEADLLYFSYPF